MTYKRETKIMVHGSEDYSQKITLTIMSLFNRDFERGTLEAWEHDGAVIDPVDPHTGKFSCKIEEDEGYIRQWLPEGIPTNELFGVQAFMRSKTGTAQVNITMYYSDGTSDSCAVAGVDEDWEGRPDAWPSIKADKLLIGFQLQTPNAPVWIDDVNLGRREIMRAVYKETPPTLSDGQPYRLTLTSDGKLRVDDPTTQDKVDDIEDKLDHAEHGLAALKALIEAIEVTPQATDESGSFSYTTGYGTSETDVSDLFTTDLTGTTRRKYIIYLDLTNFEGDANFDELHVAVKVKVDGTNYRAIDRKTITKAGIAAAAESGVPIMVPAVSQDVQITFQMSVTLAGNKTVYYHYVREALE